jgi:hypothetical protein
LRANRQEDDVVTLHNRSARAAVVGLALAAMLPGQVLGQAVGEPARLGVATGQTLTPHLDPTPNQRIANAIADQLRQNGQLRHYNVNISFQHGTAELTGQAASQAQHDEILRLVQSVGGVERVRDLLVVASGATVAQVQAVAPGPLPDAKALAPRMPDVPSPVTAPTEPLPIFQAPPPGPGNDYNPPPLPPYAWPTYAAYNNYSRVAYPTLYPYQSWPFIGPIYPFPKIPPGWRSIKLEWKDGSWWYGKTASGHDWWRIRYW